jgi:DNA-binding GntR family transcriptional regulator
LTIMTIDPDVPLPPFRQLAGILRDQISSGELAGRLPSEKWLAQNYGLAQNTVRRALGLLREEGLIQTVQGVGAFVRPA